MLIALTRVKETLKTLLGCIRVVSYEDQSQYIKSLAEYVREAVLQGHHVQDIREYLRQHGHADDAIDKAILEA